MLNTLEKVKRLERYLNVDAPSNDPVVDRIISKLILREMTRMKALESRLSEQIRGFERDYRLASAEFYTRYEQGNMGDDMDFIEWASTVEMLANVQQRLTILESETVL